jgi:hypothetical protein
VWVVVKIILKPLAKRTGFSTLSVIPGSMKTALSSTVIVNNAELGEKHPNSVTTCIYHFNN